VDTYRIYDGTDENGIVGTVAPGLFAQEGRCWRMVYESPFGLGGHCMQPVAWVGRWKFLKGWTKVWSCERHADELVGARLLLAAFIRRSFPWLGSNSPGYHAGERIADSVWQRPGRDFPPARFLRD
jgi:hypothetical protein